MDIRYLGLFLLGALACFAGYRMFTSFLRFWGAVVGAVLGFFIADYLTTGTFDIDLSRIDSTALVIAFLAGALAGALLAVTLYRGVVFVTGAGVGGLAGWYGWALLTGAPNPLPAVLLGSLCGLLAVRLERPMIILSTAASGGYALVVAGAWLFFEQVDLAGMLQRAEGDFAPLLPYLAAWVAAAALGFLVQSRT